MGIGGRSRHRHTGGKVISTQRDWKLKPRNTRNHQMAEQGRFFEGHWSEHGSFGQHLYFELLASRTMGESFSVALKSLGLWSFVTAVLTNIIP